MGFRTLRGVVHTSWDSRAPVSALGCKVDLHHVERVRKRGRLSVKRVSREVLVPEGRNDERNEKQVGVHVGGKLPDATKERLVRFARPWARTSQLEMTCPGRRWCSRRRTSLEELLPQQVFFVHRLGGVTWVLFKKGHNKRVEGRVVSAPDGVANLVHWMRPVKSAAEVEGREVGERVRQERPDKSDVAVG